MNAMTDMGTVYRNGMLGLEPDLPESIKWFSKAAQAGGITLTTLTLTLTLRLIGGVRAQASLGVAYANGEGVPQDQSKALEWLRKAATEKDPEAMMNLVTMLQGL